MSALFDTSENLNKQDFTKKNCANESKKTCCMSKKPLTCGNVYITLRYLYVFCLIAGDFFVVSDLAVTEDVVVGRTDRSECGVWRW